MTRSRQHVSAAAVLAMCGALAVGHEAAAQSSQPPSKTKVVRRPVVDLKKQAEEPRPGQVMPGQPSPQTEPADQPAAPSPGDTPPPAQPAPPPPPRPVVDLPEPAPAQPAAPAQQRPLKPAPVPVHEQRPAPAPATTARPSTEPAAEPAPAPQPVARVRAEPDPVPPLRAEAVSAPAAADPAPRAQPAPAATPAPSERPAAAVPGTAAVAKPGESVTVRVGSIDGPADVIEWRGLGEEWSPIAAGASATGRLEIRTGLGASATFVVDDQVEVKVLRLSRVRLERREPAGPGLPAEIVVEVNRGEVDIKPRTALVAGAATAVVRIVTPDKNFATRLPTGVRYDAFSGTRTRVLSAERQR